MSGMVRAIKGSLTLKVFAVCFIAVHLPLIGLLFYLGLGHPSDPIATLLVALLSTVLGCALSYMAVHRFVSPIDRLIQAVDRYQSEGKEPDLELKGSDGISRLAHKLVSLIRAQELRLKTLKRQANSDALTGLGNRRWLQNAVSLELNRATRSDQWVWVIAFDLDHFKQVNDTHGHAAGDEVLMLVAEIAQSQLRPYDLIARIGGEEFCVVSADSSPSFGFIAAERIRAALEAHKPSLGGHPTTITASFGVHKGDPHKEGFAEMLRLADAGLYGAKAKGRNLVVGSNDTSAASETFLKERT
ncbi:MAG: GGDEF domain-containing protein [Devosia sp.]|uniref:GGDEF domain-containing protein n=1 Tax=Devosia sp. TaxID=1871048 RepID=UPI003392E925